MVQLGAVGEMDVGEKQKCENWLDYPNADFWLGDLCDIPLGDIVAGWARNGMEDHASPLWAKNMEMRVGNVNPQNFAPVAGAGAGRPGTTATHKNDRAFVARQAVKCVNALRMLGEWLMLTGLLARNSNAAKYAVRQTILAQKYGQSRVAVSMHVGGVFAPLTGRPALVPEYFTGELATMNLEWLCKGLCDKVDTCVAYTFSTQDHPGAPLRCWLKGGFKKVGNRCVRQDCLKLQEAQRNLDNGGKFCRVLPGMYNEKSTSPGFKAQCGLVCHTVRDAYLCGALHKGCCEWGPRPMCDIKKSRVLDPMCKGKRNSCATMIDAYTCPTTGRNLYNDCCEWGNDKQSQLEKQCEDEEMNEPDEENES
eukprot:g9235.t1